MIALQTLTASANNFKEHQDAFSWLGQSARLGRQQCGTDNRSGIAQLIDDGMASVEPYEGDLDAPVGTAINGGDLPLVLRVTNRLINYADQFIKREEAA